MTGNIIIIYTNFYVFFEQKKTHNQNADAKANFVIFEVWNMYLVSKKSDETDLNISKFFFRYIWQQYKLWMVFFYQKIDFQNHFSE